MYLTKNKANNFKNANFRSKSANLSRKKQNGVFKTVRRGLSKFVLGKQFFKCSCLDLTTFFGKNCLQFLSANKTIIYSQLFSILIILEIL